MRPFKVLMVINQFHPIVGGAERQAQKLARGLLERGVQVEVLTARRRGLKKRELIDGIPVIRHRVFWLPIGGRKRFYTLSYLVSVFLYLVRHRKRFDILHVHQALYPAFVCTFAARLLGKKSVVKSASSAERFDLAQLHDKPLIGRLMARNICRNADQFVAISTHVCSDLARYGVTPDRIVMIPNGVDVTQREICHAGTNCNRAKFVVGYVGTLARFKNVDCLLRAWADLPVDVRCRCELLIVGDGPERTALEKYADDLGITASTTFCGRQADVGAWFERLDCYVSTSVIEGLSNSLLEAMAHKKACIVSHGVSGNVDLIHHGENGFLVDPADHGQLAQLLALLARDKDRARRIGENAYETVSQTCAMPVVVDKHIELYRTLV